MTHDPIPLLDLKAQYASIRDEIEPLLRNVADTQWFIGGPHLDAFETSLAEYCGAKHAVGCASGSDALLLSLMALGVGAGDEVICPSYTFFATAGSIWRLGARPVWVDIDPVTYNCTPESVRAAAVTCTSLKAIMPVHLFGQTVDMCGMIAVAEDLGVPLIEDAAQAIGSRDTTAAAAGSRGTTGCFSFFPSKNLGGFGDGGMITTNDRGIADHLRRLRNHGMDPKYYHHEVGLNSRLDAMQAAVLNAKLPHLDAWSDARAANASHYDQMFHEAGGGDTTASLGECRLPILTPARPEAPSRHIYNQYVLRLPASLRDDLRAHLVDQKIGHDVYYPVPLHVQECFLGLPATELPWTEQAAAESIAIPIYSELTESQRTRVAETIITFVRTHAAVGV
ncbi:MAG: DegT/DnrJ/EryC1/StrS family aminotransferase [Phycisphaerales bacterium]|jgi:dTDP-4-amino-4,6-dideoxygalactose transaminase|nr:DegT/DnrJ/EryC1/StrS family aminotransferase [Phycisphaerales bacterium]